MKTCKQTIRCPYCDEDSPGILRDSKDGRACHCARLGKVGQALCGEPALVGDLCYDHAKLCERCKEPYDPNHDFAYKELKMSKGVTGDMFPRYLFHPISLRGVVWDSIPYVVWQRLFDFYRAGKCPLDHMSNMMVDFKNCEGILPLLNSYSSVEFIWGMSPEFNDTTWISQSSWKKHNEETDKWEDRPRGVMPFVYLSGNDIHILVRVSVDDVTFKEIRKDDDPKGVSIIDHITKGE